MDTEGSGQHSEPATASSCRASEQTKCDDSRNDRENAVTIDSAHSVTRTEVSGLPSTIEMPHEDADASSVLSIGSTLDADSTPFWDSQATAISWVEGTLGAWKWTLPAPSANRAEVVPGFEILGELGHGGMGVVYKARQDRLKRLIALKMIRSDWHGNPEHLARFEIEAEAVARLNHPNIVRIYEIGKAGGVAYVVLELLEGGTLKERMAGTPQPVREAAGVLSALARGVHAAHVAGILHRDLKPSNVLFDHAGVPKIADFGLAKRLEVEEGETQTGQILGTPSYMAPEQAKGWDREIGAQADIYSLGAILYEMLTGRPPLKGTTPTETLKLVQEEDPLPPSRLRSKLPFDLETICLKCIARDPRKRYPDALSLADDLDRYLCGESILARRTSLWQRGIKQARKRPVTAVLLAVGIAAALIVALVAIREQRQENARVIGILRGADHALFDGQAALAQQRWDDVRLLATSLLSATAHESEPRIVLMRDKAERLRSQAQLGREEQAATEAARAQFRRFFDLRDEALFLDTTWFADGLGHSLEATCRAARDGLGVFGDRGTGDEWTLAPLPPALSSRERDELKRGFYQLLLILADAVSRSPGAKPAQRAEEALRIVGRAEELHVPATRAYHLRRADFLEMKGDREAADKERAIAERLTPTEAFDLFLTGRESTKRSDWHEAITQLSAATQRQPDYFWAQCLLAICHLQTHEPVKALIGLNACLQRKPDCAWLYMLRAIANTKAASENIGRRGTDQVKVASEQFAAAVGEARKKTEEVEKVKVASEQFAAAEADYRSALDRIGGMNEPAELRYVLLLNRGMMWLVRDSLTAAAADFQEAIRLNDRRFDAYVDLGQVYQRQGQTNDALEQFAKAIALRPNWAPLYRGRANVHLGLKDLSPELREMTLSELEDAIEHVTVNRRDAASRDLADAIRYELPGNHLIAADWTKQAAIFHAADRENEALNACDAALDIARRYAPAHELRIKVLLDLRQYSDLIQSCDVVLAWAKPSAKLYELRGIAKNAIGDFSGAIGDYTQALALAVNADSPRLLRYRGWSNLANDAFWTAVNDFDKSIGLAPANGDAYLGRGLARARLGLYHDAEVDAEKALKYGDATPLFAFRVARIYSQAALAVSLEARSKRENADRSFLRYQDLAVTNVRLALKRTPAPQRPAFFRETIQPDPAMKAISKRLRSLESLQIDQPAPP
jgi:tetratricopeptide (TPR) repeat protein